ncbi:hypothetical protein [Porphyrobacter sp. GA68]|uniref:hypothetical protein n=1 Tax=Porphyrobacter sp. GA68 TaxID=2883480 RepID=UPI001D195C63|nr:hypothetical protein [Porphyrobacter sp. GA68]
MAGNFHVGAREEVPAMTRTKKMENRAASEALFGSCARGDTDRLSDRDFLIVDDDVAVLRARAMSLKAEGVSVASYTFRKLEALAERGALFLQHLRLEASIVSDRNERLAKLLDGFRPNECYDREIRDNSNLAALITTIPPGPNAELWAADVLYVTVRNFGVLWLASRGRHLFAYDRILEALQEEGLLHAAGISTLRRLRFLKSLYRSDDSATSGTVIRMIREALAGLPEEYFPSAIRTVPAGEVLAGPSPADGSPAYLQVRDLEKRIIAARFLGCNRFADPALTSLNEWVRNPRAYANLSASKAPELRRRLAALGDISQIVRNG